VRLELGARLAVPVVTKNYVIPGERKIFEASAVGGFGFVGVGFGGP
jgi:hypothetical protein